MLRSGLQVWAMSEVTPLPPAFSNQSVESTQRTGPLSDLQLSEALDTSYTAASSSCFTIFMCWRSYPSKSNPLTYCYSPITTRSF